MTFNQDPPRLLDAESQVDAGLREVLHRVSTSTPTAAQLHALALKVTATPFAPGAVRGAFKAQPFLTKAGVVKLSAALLVGSGVAAWLGWQAQPSSDGGRDNPARAAGTTAETARETAPDVNAVVLPARSARAVAPTARAAVKPTPAIETPARVQHGSAPGELLVEEPPARSRSRARPQRSARSGPPTTSSSRSPQVESPPTALQPSAATPLPKAEPASELELLGRAQGLLAREPAEALEVIDQHARAYPNGEFAQEREALAIDALRRLGRSQALQARARAFLQRYPASPHRDRIAAWLR